jgi:hypothetical protein
MSNMTLAEQLRARLAERELAQWAEDDTAHKKMEVKKSPFQVSNNLCRTAYEQVRDFPDTRKNVTNALKARGYKIGSISAVIGQMIRQRAAQPDDEGVLHVTTAEYTPLKSSATLRNMEKKAKQKQVLVDVRKKTTRVVEKRPVSSSVGAGLTALVPTPAPTPAPTPEIPRVDALLRSLSAARVNRPSRSPDSALAHPSRALTRVRALRYRKDSWKCVARLVMARSGSGT